MKPKASLKSAKTNFLVMASRSFTSLQPLSRASALLRAAPESFCAMCKLPGGRQQSRKCRAKSLPTKRQDVPAGFLGGRYGLVAQDRIGRRHGGPYPCDISIVSGLDFRCQLRQWRPAAGLERAFVPGAAVSVRAAARIRPHLHGPWLRRFDP